MPKLSITLKTTKIHLAKKTKKKTKNKSKQPNHKANQLNAILRLSAVCQVVAIVVARRCTQVSHFHDSVILRSFASNDLFLLLLLF